jgi:hypothetical protein
MDQGHREVPTPELRPPVRCTTVTGKQLVGSRISDDQGPLGRVPPLPANQPDGPAAVSWSGPDRG